MQLFSDQRSSRRCGFSLLEALLAGVIMTAALIPIVANFDSLFRGFKKTFQITHATFLGQAILENVRWRLYDGDPRFFKLNDPAPVREQKLRDRRYQDFFMALREEGARVTQTAGDECSKYFADFHNLKETKLHGITRESNPVLFDQLGSYRAQLTVSLSTPASVVDSDADQHEDVDMAEVGVTISWVDATGAERQQEFWTMFTRHEYNPYPRGPE